MTGLIVRLKPVRVRTRFTLAGVTAILGLVVLAVPGILRTADSDARRQVDDQLLAVARTAVPALVSAGAAGLSIPSWPQGDVGVALVGSDGVVTRLGQAPRPLPDRLPTSQIAGAITLVQRAPGGTRRWRVLTVTVDDRLRTTPTAPVAVQLATSLDAADAQVARTGRSVLSGAVILLLLAAGLSWLVGGLAARPLRRLHRAVERLRPNERVPANQHVSEVDAVAATLNRLLDRVEAEQRRTGDALEVARSFAAAAAHELRTPLTSLRANLDVMAGHPQLPRADADHVISDAQNDLGRVTALLSGLAELARGDLQTAGIGDSVNLAEIADEVVQTARGHANREVELVAPEVAVVHGRPEGLRMLIANLIDNALAHGSEPVLISLVAAGSVLRLTVEDAGPGVPFADRERIFERFTRGATHVPGSGLGLALVAQQARLHGGSVHVEEASTGGARFVVELPLERTGRS